MGPETWMAIAAVSMAAGTGAAVADSHQQKKALKSAAAGEQDRVNRSIKEAKDAEATSAAQAGAAVRRRLMNRTQTVYTSPMGVSGAAGAARKTLLGQ
jgi:hypothetical protein